MYFTKSGGPPGCFDTIFCVAIFVPKILLEIQNKSRNPKKKNEKDKAWSILVVGWCPEDITFVQQQPPKYQIRKRLKLVMLPDSR